MCIELMLDHEKMATNLTVNGHHEINTNIQKCYGLRNDSLSSTEFVDIVSELGLQVRSLVLVDDVYLCQLVKHLLHGRQLLLSFGLVLCGTQLTHSHTHLASIVAVV